MIASVVWSFHHDAHQPEDLLGFSGSKSEISSLGFFFNLLLTKLMLSSAKFLRSWVPCTAWRPVAAPRQRKEQLPSLRFGFPQELLRKVLTEAGPLGLASRTPCRGIQWPQSACTRQPGSPSLHSGIGHRSKCCMAPSSGQPHGTKCHMESTLH